MDDQRYLSLFHEPENSEEENPEDTPNTTKKPRYQNNCCEWLCKPCLSDAARKKLHVKMVTHALRPKLASLTKTKKLNFICGHVGTVPGLKKLMVNEINQNCVYMKRSKYEFIVAGEIGVGAWSLVSEQTKTTPLCMVYDDVVINVPWEAIEMNVQFERSDSIVDKQKVIIDYVPENQFMAVLGYVEDKMDTGQFNFEMRPIGNDHIEEMKVQRLLAEEEIESLESMKDHIMMTNSEAVLACVEPDEECDYDTFFEKWKRENSLKSEKEEKKKAQVANEKKKNDMKAAV